MQNTLNIALGIIVLALFTWIIFKPNANISSPNQTLSPSPSAQLSNTQEENPMPSAKSESTKKQYEKAGSATKAGKSYTAVIKTSAGDITVELSKETPIATNNFVFLAKEKFYDGVIFHRVIPGFMVQGGDPTGTGTGGPGYKFADEKFTGEYKRGVIAMANSGANTNGSQFFIMHADYPLPPSYVIFGMTKSGLEVVDKIASGKTGPSDRPLEPVSIKSIDIIEK
jgi:cyclophilin family peptidyl-prolyl cis-trans isomerase